MAQPTISFEFFPPKTPASEKMLWESIPLLAALAPKFMTVTYGAGGSTKDGTCETVLRMKKETGIPVAAHLTYINMPIETLRELTGNWWAQGIRQIVAIRGDLPEGLAWPLDPDPAYFQQTSTFVKALKSWNDFEISVGAYPEKHPSAPDSKADIEALKQKCDAGADRAITQFFFDNDVYYRFVDACRATGITAPICPGLLPIHDFAGMLRFAARCKTSVPDPIREQFSGLEGKPEEAHKRAIDILTRQVRDLAENGAEHLHFYTLNKSAITREACEMFGFPRNSG